MKRKGLALLLSLVMAISIPAQVAFGNDLGDVIVEMEEDEYSYDNYGSTVADDSLIIDSVEEETEENSGVGIETEETQTELLLVESGNIFSEAETDIESETEEYSLTTDEISVISENDDISTVAEVASSGTCGDNLIWELDSEGTLTISGTGNMTSYSSTDASPWDSDRKAIISVVILDGVTNIGSYAFYYCTSLTSVTIPDSVSYIGSYAFYRCTSLTSVTIPDNVTSISSYAFYWCTSIINLTISNNVTYIGSYAFSKCTSLSSITIPDSVSYIGSDAFSGCASLTSVTIPDNVTSIYYHTFNGCTSLTSVTIPDSVTSIGSNAFFGCTSLTSVAIPDSVTSIGSDAFSGCTSLTSVTIPDSVKSIGSYAFKGCTNLTSATIPDSVTSIKSQTFSGCTSLTSVTIPDSVTSIGSYAFDSCKSLMSVTVPDNVASIESGVFQMCISLTSVTIPNNVTSIGTAAFHSCTSLTDVYYNGSEEEWSAISIGSSNKSLTSATIHYSSTNNSEESEADAVSIYINGYFDGINYNSGTDHAILGYDSSWEITLDVEDGTDTQTVFDGMTWTSSDTSIATVSFDPTGQSGAFLSTGNNAALTISPHKAGTVTITGTTSEGSTISETVSVEPELTITGDTIKSGGTLSCTVVLDSADADYLEKFISQLTIKVSADLSAPAISSSQYKVSADGLSATYTWTFDVDYSDSGTVTVTSASGQTVSKTLSFVGNHLVGTNGAIFDFPDDAWSFSNYSIVPIPISGEYYNKLISGQTSSTIFMLNDLINVDYHGQCYGFALSALLSNENILSLNSIQSNISALSAAGLNANTQSIIGYYFMHQFTGKAIENVDNYMSKTVEQQLEIIYNMASPFILSFGCEGWGTHAVLGYGLDTDGSWTYHGTTYNTRVLIYDSNHPDGDEKSYLYFNKGTAEWEVPNYYSNGISYKGNGYLKRACSDLNILSYSDWDFSKKYQSWLRSENIIVVDLISSSSVQISGGKSTDSNILTYYDDATLLDGASMINAFFKNESFFTVKPVTASDPLSVSVAYDGAYLTASAEGYESADFDESGIISLHGIDGEYELTMASDDSSISYPEVEVSGKGASEISLSMTDEGIVLTGNDLSNVTVKSESLTDSKKTVINTDSDNVLIKTDSNGELEIETPVKTLSAGKRSSLKNKAGGIQINWLKVSGASGYYIYRKTSSGKYKKIKTITSGSTVSYTDTKVKSKNGTKYTYKVIPYSGSTEGSFTAKTIVRLTGVKLSSVKSSAARKATVKWKKTTKVSGYQIQYSTSKTFAKGNKTVKVSGAKKTSKTLTGLKKGKTYYVRIRTYKKVNGKTYYSAWSSKKTVKIKK